MAEPSVPGRSRSPGAIAGLRRVAFGFGYCAFSAAFGSLLAFALLDASPSLRRAVGATNLRYWALQEEYVADPELVYAPKRTSSSFATASKGDLFRSYFGIETPTIEYEATFDEFGFRNESPPGSVDVLVVGDSYVQIGETNEDTLSAWISRESGFTAHNLGRGGYGPFQYVILLRRHAPRLRPRFALYCHFDGNDAEDARRYIRWRTGGLYNGWGIQERIFPRRFALVANETREFAARRARELLAGSPDARGDANRRSVHTDVALIELAGRSVPMAFGYFPRRKTAAALLDSEAWHALRSQLSAFREFSERLGIDPVAVFIPTKIETYARRIRPDSGARVRKRATRALPYVDASREAFGAVADAVGIRVVDLTPAFRRRAAAGEVLYYPFDSHWNSAGREAAGAVIGEVLRGIRSGVPPS